MTEIIAELVKVLPENDWMKLALLVFALMLVILREKLFVGVREICRYMYRWIMCRFGKHTWLSGSGKPSRDMLTGLYVYYCVICGREEDMTPSDEPKTTNIR